jgi:hypothetical protein
MSDIEMRRLFNQVEREERRERLSYDFSMKTPQEELEQLAVQLEAERQKLLQLIAEMDEYMEMYPVWLH